LIGHREKQNYYFSLPTILRNIVKQPPNMSRPSIISTIVIALFFALRNGGTTFVLGHLADGHFHNHDHHHEDEDGSSYWCGTRSPNELEKKNLQDRFVQWKRQQQQQQWNDEQQPRSLQDDEPGSAVIAVPPPAGDNTTTNGYSIPLHFAVLESEDGRGNISDAQLLDMVNAVNYGFRDTPFSFFHIGTHRAQNDTYFKCDPAFEENFKSEYRVGGMETLNVFLCNLFADGRFGIYGVADFPTEEFSVYDGVILMNPTLPKEGVTYDYMEAIVTHEVGHCAYLTALYENHHAVLVVI